MSERDDYILPRFFSLDRRGERGHQAFIIGHPGEGKTSLLQYLTYLAVIGRDIYGKTREQQQGIWRVRRHDRYFDFFGLGIGILALPEGSNYNLVKVYEDDTEESIKLEELEDEGIPYIFYRDAEDLVSKLQEGKVMCIPYEGGTHEETEFYANLFEAINNRKSQKWIHIAIDEIQDILKPYRAETMTINGRFADAVSDFRKRLVNSEFACHDPAIELDYRLIPNVKFHIYKRGATKMRNDSTRVKQQTINTLDVNEAFIINTAFWDSFTFPKMPDNNRYKYDIQTVPVNFKGKVEIVSDDFPPTKGR